MQCCSGTSPLQDFAMDGNVTIPGIGTGHVEWEQDTYGTGM